MQDHVTKQMKGSGNEINLIPVTAASYPKTSHSNINCDPNIQHHSGINHHSNIQHHSEIKHH